MSDQKLLQNDPDSIKYRKNADNLIILGTGVIVFGFWSIVKIVAQFALNISFYDESLVDDMDPIGIIFVTVFVILFYAGDMAIRLIVGLGARAEGRDVQKRKKRRPRKTYLVFNVWLILFSIISVIIAVNVFITSDALTFNNMISLFMELSSLIILLELFISALYVRKYRREHKETEGM